MADHEKEIFIERAVRLAQKRVESSQSGGNLMVVEFLLYPEIYAIEASFVQEVLTLKDLTYIPGTPAFVAGLFNYRGNIISLVNLKILFGLAERGLTEMNKVILIRNHHMEFGLIADGINGSLHLRADDITEPPDSLSSNGAQFIRGMTPSGAILLRTERLLDDKSLQVNQSYT